MRSGEVSLDRGGSDPGPGAPGNASAVVRSVSSSKGSSEVHSYYRWLDRAHRLN